MRVLSSHARNDIAPHRAVLPSALPHVASHRPTIPRPHFRAFIATAAQVMWGGFTGLGATIRF